MVLHYWPDQDSVNACIKNEAETADDAVILAVHRPSIILRRAEGSETQTRMSEKDLLDAFTSDNVPGGALLLPITGASGAGKSHVIRWLDAQLRRSEKRERYHIIRIPKSASLRTVVELILEPLKNDPRYQKPWKDLTRAVTEVNIDTAVVNFRAHLQNVLTARENELLASHRSGTGPKNVVQLIGLARDLPRLLSDAATEEHFARVLARIIDRALKGVEGEVETAETLTRFVAQDFRLPPDVDITRSSDRVRNFYLRNIAPMEPERIGDALGLLNDAIDPAINSLFQLEQSTGGVTLQEIILSVRELLWNGGADDQKDLVLLVEDFAALAGIQDVLLKVCIQEGISQGKQERATMRTALALTDGLSFRDTILTRARHEWVIDGKFNSDDEVRDAVVDMVGSYLNAARWGERELNRMFRERTSHGSLTDWLPVWQDETQGEQDAEAIAAFGTSKNGVPLFPFTRSGIEVFSKRILAKADRLEFNPRRVINQIIREVLLMRTSFEAGEFPPAFDGYRTTAPIAEWVSQRHLPEKVSRRLTSVLAIWAGNPSEANALGTLPPAIFKTFGVPSPTDLGGVIAPSPKPIPVDPLAGQPRQINSLPKPRLPSPVEDEDQRIEAMRRKLEGWANGIELDQAAANSLRSVLMQMALDSINWPELRVRKVSLPHPLIEIPKARGNINPRYRISADASDDNALLRTGLLAVFRYHVNACGWDYAGADDDYVRSMVLVDYLASQIKADVLKQSKRTLQSVAQALVTQARIVGLEPPVKPTRPEDLLNAVMVLPPSRPHHPFEERWDSVKEAMLGQINGVSAREALQAFLLENAGAFQGLGKTPFAIDTVRLVQAFSEDFGEQALLDMPNEIKTFLRLTSEAAIRSGISQATAKIQRFKNEVDAEFGDNFDKGAFVSDIRSIFMKLVDTGIFVSFPFSKEEYLARLTEFSTSPVMGMLDKIEKLLSADRSDLPRILNALGSLDLGMIGRTLEFLGQTNTLLHVTEVATNREEANRKMADPDKYVREITQFMTEISGEIDKSTGESI